MKRLYILTTIGLGSLFICNRNCKNIYCDMLKIMFSHKLKQLDMLIAQLTISAYLNKPFRFKDFSKCSYKTLRTNGLPSLLHRHRLFKQGHLKVDFLAMCNAIVVQRHEDMQAKRTQRLNQLKLAKMSKNIDVKPESTNA